LKEIHVPYIYTLLFAVKILIYLNLLSDGIMAAPLISENTWYGNKHEVVLFSRIIPANQINNSAEVDSATNAFVPIVSDGMNGEANASTTVFHTDANVVTVGVTNPQYTPDLLVGASTDQLTQELKYFLGKPVVAQSGVLSTADTVTTFPAVQAHVPFRNSLYANKLAGFYGIRYDLVIKLVVNATRFQAGRYLVVWNPYGGTDPTLKFASMKTSRLYKLTQRTTMPHAEIDVSCDTELEFVIPFSNSLNFSPVALFTSVAFNYGSIGEVQIFPYSPLNAVAGATTANYTMYFSMRNVELYGATVPQAGGFNASRKGKTAQSVEQASAGMGPISSSLATVSKSLSILSEVPLLSSYARTTAWFADRMSKTAEIFGFTKPVNIEHAQRVTRNIMHYVGSVDGPDQSIPLSLSYKNEIGHMSGISPTDIDEMDLNFVASVPAYVTQFTWTTLDTSSTLKLSLPVTPLFGSTASVVNGANVLTDAPCSFVSRFFKFWRGSVVYKFKIVRTEFHSGRLSFSFNPNFQDLTVPANPPYADLNYIHREIIDIREHTEFTLTIPYISASPYTLCLPSNPNNGIGTLTIHVVDPLVAPSTVMQNAIVLVEIAAGPDMEWAVPVSFLPTPFTNVVPQSGTFRGGNSYDSACNILVKTIGDSVVRKDADISALVCIGEKVSSFRTMVKKPQFLTQTATVVPALVTSVVPYLIPMYSQNGVTNTTPGVNGDLYGMLGSMYVYSRGGVRIKFIDPVASSGGTQATYMTTAVPPVAPTDLYTRGAFDVNGTIGPQTFQGMLPNNLSLPEQGTEVQVPAYYQLPLRVNVDCYANTQFPYNSENGTATRQHVPDVYVNRTLLGFNVVQSPRLTRSLSDDGNFSYFLCIPPYVSQTAAL